VGRGAGGGRQEMIDKPRAVRTREGARKKRRREINRQMKRGRALLTRQKNSALARGRIALEASRAGPYG